MNHKNAIDFILESLNGRDSIQDDYSELFSQLSENIILFDDLETTEETFFNDDCSVDEAKTVTFGNSTYPKENWAVILAGGPGSGKGYVISKKIAIDAKIIDVDRLKELYTKMAKRPGSHVKDDRKYDFKNPDDVGALHDIVDKKQYKEKTEDAFFAAHQNGRRPNIIYDITGSKADKLKNLGKMLTEMGYKVSLVWVLTNRQVALMRNMCRARVVPQKIFHETHNKVNSNVFPFLQSSDAKYYEEAWVVFNSPDSMKELSPDEKKEFDKFGVVKLPKSGSSFTIPEDVMDRVMKTLGPEEENPDDPKIYKSYMEIESTPDIFDKAKKGQAGLLRKES